MYRNTGSIQVGITTVIILPRFCQALKVQKVISLPMQTTVANCCSLSLIKKKNFFCLKKKKSAVRFLFYYANNISKKKFFFSIENVLHVRHFQYFRVIFLSSNQKKKNAVCKVSEQEIH